MTPASLRLARARHLARSWKPGWWPDRWTVLAALCAAYVPVLASSPGTVGIDTKVYLYLDPGRLLHDATSLWEADRALGTVTHQTIGYLWPMGPFFWLFEAIGSPDWLAQRLWLGTLLAAAGLGVRYLLRTLGFDGRGLLVAVLVYELSPYLLNYAVRHSIVLVPWAALGWLIGLTVKSARSNGWRYPALFAIVAATAGSVNATSLAMVGLAPVLWLVHAAAVERSVAPRRAVGAALRIGALSLGVSLWWITGLLIQSAYSLSTVRYTEPYQLVAESSTSTEILRGLGYWYFYGFDKLGLLVDSSINYTLGNWLVFISFGIVVGALALGAAVRWQHRSYFLLLFAVGALVAVGAHPYDSPSPLGGAFKALTRIDAGLALRSTPRAVPMVSLAVAVLAGAGVGALSRRARRLGAFIGCGVVLAVVLNNPAIWKAQMVGEYMQRPEQLPQYWLEAAADLDRTNTDTRVWEVPGSDFASYRWGTTIDPITPGLMDRGYVARELVPFGSAPSAALLSAVDRRMQEDTLEPESLAPVARLMSVGDVVHRADLTYERYRTPRPVETAALLARAPGLEEAAAYGESTPNVAGPEQPMIDEVHLARPVDAEHPAPVTRFAVADPLPVLRTRSIDGAVVLIGDADGIVDAAAAGVLDTSRPLFMAADLIDDSELRELALGGPAHIVVTDSNRRRAQRWGTIRENRGHTESEGEAPLIEDPADQRLPVFAADAATADDTLTVSEQRGPVSARATGYGNPVLYVAEDRPVHAVDSSVDTAWKVAAFSAAVGEVLQLRLDEPTKIDAVRLVQPLRRADLPVFTRPPNRHITKVEIRADGRRIAIAELDERSLAPAGQNIPLGVVASVVEIEILEDNLGDLGSYGGIDGVGFAEVDLGVGPTTEVIRTPRALMDSIADDLGDHAVTVVLTRERSNPREPLRSDPEAAIARAVPMPGPREAELRGSARLSARAPSWIIDDLLGLSGDPVEASSSGRLAGDLASRASAMLDGDATTAWTGSFAPPDGQWIEFAFQEPAAADLVEIDVVVDSLHSVPSAFRALLDGIDAGTFETGLALVDNPPASVATVTVPLERPARTIRLVAEQVRERLTPDWHSNTLQALPISITEVRFGQVEAGPDHTSRFDTGCRYDLLTVNGEPAPVRVTGSVEDAEARRRLDLEGCEPVTLTAGETLVVAYAGSGTGIDIDQIVLSSPAGSPVPAAATTGVEVLRSTDTAIDALVPAAATSRWLVLGQSHNRGWHATAGGVDLGPPVVIDGFANGWLLPPGETTEIELRWTPQRWVSRALVASALFALAAVAAALRGRRDPGPRTVRAAARLGPARPELVLPVLEAGTGRAPIPAAAIAASGAAMVAVLNLPEWPRWVWIGPLLGMVTFVAARWRRGAGVLLLGAATSLGAAATWIMVEQSRFHHPPGFGWPRYFEEVHILGVVTILLVLAAWAREVASTRLDPHAHVGER